jgi:hypothetical protein
MVLVHRPRTNNVLAMYWVSTSPLAPSVTTPGEVTADVPKPKEIAEEPKNEVLIPDSKDDGEIGVTTPIATETHTTQILQSQSADPTTRNRNFKPVPLSSWEGTLSQTSETTEDDESSIVSESKKYGLRIGRKKRALSVDPRREALEFPRPGAPLPGHVLPSRR